MNTTEQDIKALRRKTKSWLAILIYQCAQGRTRLDALNQRLMSLYQSVFKPEVIRETMISAVQTPPNEKSTPSIKKRVLRRLTPAKVEKRILNYSQVIGSKNLVQKKNHVTLGRLAITWAVLSNQPTKEFLIKVIPSINRIYLDWHKATGCSGLSDEEFLSHPKESARFWSGFLRTLIKETPGNNLVVFGQGGIQALSAVVGMPGIDKKFNDLLKKATRVVTEETAKRIESALKESPHARERINIPELEALVLREERKLGWRKNTEEQTVRILRENLSPKLKEEVGDKDEVIRTSMEAVGRRGLLNNLEAALKGQLRPRFIKSVWYFLQSVSRMVTSTWEFETSSPIKEQMTSIRQWLFRR